MMIRAKAAAEAAAETAAATAAAEEKAAAEEIQEAKAAAETAAAEEKAAAEEIQEEKTMETAVETAMETELVSKKRGRAYGKDLANHTVVEFEGTSYGSFKTPPRSRERYRVQETTPNPQPRQKPRRNCVSHRCCNTSTGATNDDGSPLCDKHARDACSSDDDCEYDDDDRKYDDQKYDSTIAARHAHNQRIEARLKNSDHATFKNHLDHEVSVGEWET
jgi:hypothetical protein